MAKSLDELLDMSNYRLIEAQMTCLRATLSGPSGGVHLA